MTTGDKKLPQWQDDIRRKFDDLLHEDGFRVRLSDLEVLHLNYLKGQLDFNQMFFRVKRLCDDYQLGDNAISLVFAYAKNKRFDGERIGSDISIVSHKERTVGPHDSVELENRHYHIDELFPRSGGVYIYVPETTSRTQLKSYIDSNWEYIESKIGKSKRYRKRTKAQLHKEIYSMHKKGMSSGEIARRINDSDDFSDPIEYTYVAKVVREQKRKNK